MKAGAVDIPSFVQAAVRGVRRARRPSDSTDNFMIALSGGLKSLGRNGTLSEKRESLKVK